MKFCYGILFISSILIFCLHCQRHIASPDSKKEEASDVLINNDASDLSTRIHYKESAAMPLYDLYENVNEIQPVLVSTPCLFMLDSQILPPVVNDSQLSLEKIKFKDDFACFLYYSQENYYYSLIRVLYIPDSRVPVFISEAQFLNRRITAFDFVDHRFILSARIGAGVMEDKAIQCSNIIERINLNNKLFFPETLMLPYKYGTIQEIAIEGEKACLITEDGEAFQILNLETMVLESQIDLNKPRALTKYRNQFLVAQILPLRLHFINPFETGIYHTQIYDEKQSLNRLSNLTLYDNITVLPYGQSGIRMMNIETGKTIQSIDSDASSFNTIPGCCNTLDITAGQNFIAAAQGLSGCAMMIRETASAPYFEKLGNLDFNSSVEIVASQNDLMLVGTADQQIHLIHIQQGIASEGNFQYLCPWDALGKPQNVFIQKDQENEDLFNLMMTQLPEKKHVKKYNAKLLDERLDCIQLGASSMIEVTFLGEKTGHKHAMGFYAWDDSSTNSGCSEFKKNILFPNLSALGRGGALLPGMTIPIGPFEAGSKISFFLVTQGWAGDYVSQGVDVFETNKLPIDKKQHLMFPGLKENEFILSFEETNRENPNCDHDFNDVIMKISLLPETAD